MISNATKRSVLRSIHLIFAIPIIGYVYSPFAELPNYAPVVRFVSSPVLVLSEFGCTQAYSSPSLASRYGSVHFICLELGRLSCLATHITPKFDHFGSVQLSFVVRPTVELR